MTRRLRSQELSAVYFVGGWEEQGVRGCVSDTFFVALRCSAGVAQEHLGFCKSLAQER